MIETEDRRFCDIFPLGKKRESNVHKRFFAKQIFQTFKQKISTNLIEKKG
jgi:hypothetical protein